EPEAEAQARANGTELQVAFYRAEVVEDHAPHALPVEREPQRKAPGEVEVAADGVVARAGPRAHAAIAEAADAAGTAPVEPLEERGVLVDEAAVEPKLQHRRAIGQVAVEGHVPREAGGELLERGAAEHAEALPADAGVEPPGGEQEVVDVAVAKICPEAGDRGVPLELDVFGRAIADRVVEVVDLHILPAEADPGAPVAPEARTEPDAPAGMALLELAPAVAAPVGVGPEAEVLVEQVRLE